MNQFELKSVINELNNLKSFVDVALKVIENLQEENRLLIEEINRKAGRDTDTIAVKDIAKCLGISISTTVEWIKNGRIKGRKEGGKWLVFYDDFMKFRNKIS